MGAVAVMVHTATLAWRPIASAGPEQRDGRDVLAWAGYLAVISWCDGWRDAVGRPFTSATHFAEVEGPR
jgi:hypothetical protein